MSLRDKSTYRHERETRIDVRRFRLVILEGPELKDEKSRARKSWESTSEGCSVGSHASNDVIIEDKTVSRFHCKIEMAAGGSRVRDLGSTNGTVVDGVEVESAFLRDGSTLQFGDVVVRFDLLNEINRLPISKRTQFGSMVSSSVVMRGCFGIMERAASCHATVLFEGETGTGKTTAAEAIHQESARKNGLFLVVDCSALSQNLIEDELFGHKSGAFTGATTTRKGVFEAADGGTVFLDEIGELPFELQSKLLRVIQERKVRRLGDSEEFGVDVRIMAATHKDLQREVNAGRFREDLYHRLNVLTVRMPAIRERPGDIPPLVARLLDDLGASPEMRQKLCSGEFLANLARASWPGNIRELRNHLERCLIFEHPLPVEGRWIRQSERAYSVDARKSYKEERERALRNFEHDYVEHLMQVHDGHVTKAAAAAKLTRVYLHRLLKKFGIRGE